jgi:hypothetical protein
LRKAHTASDGIIGHKLVFVASNKLANCDKRTKLDHFVKADVAASTVPVETLSDQLVSYR